MQWGNAKLNKALCRSSKEIFPARLHLVGLPRIVSQNGRLSSRKKASSVLPETSCKTVNPPFMIVQTSPSLYFFSSLEEDRKCFFVIFQDLQKYHLLIPVTNSLKLMRESLFSSRSRNKRPASTGVCAPQDQGVKLMNSSLNCSMSMRYCSR